MKPCSKGFMPCMLSAGSELRACQRWQHFPQFCHHVGPPQSHACCERQSQKLRLLRGHARVPCRYKHSGVQVKRRWDDDVVFKNQTRGEPKAQKTMINDTIRNDFHRRFLNRYVK